MSRGINRCQELTRAIKRYQDVSRVSIGIRLNQEVSKCINGCEVHHEEYIKYQDNPEYLEYPEYQIYDKYQNLVNGINLINGITRSVLTYKLIPKVTCKVIHKMTYKVICKVIRKETCNVIASFHIS